MMKTPPIIAGLNRIRRKTNRNITREYTEIDDKDFGYLEALRKKLSELKCTTSNGKTIYIGELLSQETQCLTLGRVLFAMGLNHREHGQITPVCYQKSARHDKIIESYLMTPGVYLHSKSISDFYYSMMAMALSVGYVIRNGRSVDRLLEYKINGVNIGNPIYDWLLRSNDIVTIDFLKWERDLFYFWEAIKLALIVTHKFKKNKPAYYLCWDDTYIEGIAVEIASKMGARIIALSDNVIIEKTDLSKMYSQSQIYHMLTKKAIERADYIPGKVEEYLMNMRNNNKTVINWLDTTQESLNGSELKKNGKKNVVIFSHCLKDAPRFGEGRIFRDYYTWLEQTINIAKNIDTVNWYIKEHPHSEYYSEDKLVENFVKNTNVKILSKKYSVEQLIENCDCIITCAGTAGAEYPCFGIPVIVAFKTWYTGFGFTIDSDSIEEYKNNILNIDYISKLDSQAINKARIALNSYLEKREYDNTDAFYSIIGEFLKKAWSGTNDEDAFFEKIITIPDLSKTDIYQKGLDWR